MMVAVASKVAALVEVASKTTREEEPGTASLPQLPAVVQLLSAPPPSQVTEKLQLPLPPLSTLLKADPEVIEALLFARRTRFAVSVPVTARVHDEAGSRLSRLPVCPPRVAFPATVMVRPANPAREEEVPPVMLKFPPETVVRFMPDKSSVPAVWLKEAQVRALLERVRAPLPEWRMAGWVVEAFGVNGWVEDPVNSKTPVPAVRVPREERFTDPAVFNVLEPKSRAPPEAETPVKIWVNPDPSPNDPVVRVRVPAVRAFEAMTVPPDPF